MPEEQACDDCSIDGFFKRANLTLVEDQAECVRFVEQLYPHDRISLPPSQGYCSMTVCVGDDKIIQFRSSSHQLDLRITKAAQLVYGRQAPSTIYVATLKSGLLAYRMQRIEGTSLRDLRMRNGSFLPKIYLARLSKDFAAFNAASWHFRDTTQQLPLGIVGSSIVSRLKMLSAGLPARLQPIARRIIQEFHRIEALPWVLNHGDIVASNIMVDTVSGSLTGIVDWAEAEKLPFGTCFYGLEEILGELTSSGFRYHEDASRLREMFWDELRDRIPELENSVLLEAVRLARDLGVLLWHGIAFDNGAIDRVVQEDQDIAEISRLDIFFNQQSSKN